MSASKIDPRGQSRRSFISLVGIAGAAALLGARPQSAPAQAGGQLPHLADSDPTAKALGYTEDAGKVDKTKFPSYKAGARCATCNFYQGAAGQAYGPCQIFPGKAVNANGWCASHTPKA
ncbi:MAG TPA: high-potential iron-sulfur protein [Steroidobacteraceae bacterium]|nr:high-potential iron-sulfur protein [Steroidobacteraceae bacterium]